MIYNDADPFEAERYELREPPRYTFSLSRRSFVQSMGAGLLVTAFVDFAGAQERRGQGGQKSSLGARFHIDKDGMVTAFTSKVEIGQGSRTQLSQAVAEELHVPFANVRLVMADTSVVPNDGGTAGSQTTPRTVPVMRNAAAAARVLLIELACKQWNLAPDKAAMNAGVIEHADGKRISLAELVASVTEFDAAMNERPAEGAGLTPPDAWKVLGTPTAKVNAADIVQGKHRYTSDLKRPGMVYGRILRAPSYGAELTDIDLKLAQAIQGVAVLRDGAFVGVTAPSAHVAQQAIAALEATAKWTEKQHPSSADLFTYLKNNIQYGGEGDRSRLDASGNVDVAIKAGPTVLRASYEIPYIQHAPMEPRAAVAELVDDVMTVWTATQQPLRVWDEVAEALAMPKEKVRIIVPDSGGGFGGKHSGDAAVEAARLALDVKKPVAVHWTRKEEFTWAYFRPAGVIDIAAAIDTDGKVTAWDHTNYNSGGSGIGCPYTFARKRSQFRNCDSPLRQGSYRALAATANNFAREAFIDELALAVGADPLAFRLTYLAEDRMKNVLNAVAEKVGWTTLRAQKKAGTGYGIACGTEKGSFVATFAEVQVSASEYAIKRAVIAFECGAVMNPKNLQSQIEGCVIMGLGAVLREAMEFKDGKIANPHFKQYEVPRFSDVPELDILVLNRPDLPSVGAGETPIIAIAPAVANAILHATAKPLHALPLRLT